MADKQGDLRDELCAVMMTHLERQDVNLVQAATAALGACAVALGALPQPGREKVAEALSVVLLDHANRRAAELRRGSHDDRRPRTNRGAALMLHVSALIAQAEQEDSHGG